MTVEPGSTSRICPQCGAETSANFCGEDGFATVEKARLVRRGASDEGQVVASRYRLNQVMGEGPLGVVYRATDLEAGSSVVVQLLPPQLGQDLELVARFQREGRLVRVLEHPNIVRTLEFGLCEDGRLFIAEELVLGPTLAEALGRSGPFDPRRIVAIAKELFAALTAAHASGILHRSLSLDNVLLVTRPGLPETVMVRDFGLAQWLADDAAEPFVWPAPLVLAWPTMAPEQARGRGISGHADLYSAGAILYALLTGHPVFPETAPSDLLVAHSVRSPPPPEREGRPLTGPLIDLVMQCLEKKPWNRPESAARLLAVLEEAGPIPVLGAPSPTLEFGPPPADTRAPLSVATPRKSASREVDSSPPTRISNPRMAAVRLDEAATRLVDRTSLAQTRIAEAPLAPPRDLGPVNDFEASFEAPAPRRRSPSPLLAFFLGLILAGGLAAAIVWLSSGDGPATPASTTEHLPVAATAGDSGPTLAESGPETHGLNAADASGPADVGSGLSEVAAGDTSAAEVAAGDTSAAEVAAGDTSAAEIALGDASAAEVAVDAGHLDAVTAALNEGSAADTRPAPASDAARLDTGMAALNDGSVAVADTQLLGDASRTKPDARGHGDTSREVKPPKDPLADLEDPEFSTPREVIARKVLVDSEPVGATVSANGRVIGETPLYVEWQEGTSGVDIAVSKEGHRTIRTRIGPGLGKSIKLVLTPLPAPSP